MNALLALLGIAWPLGSASLFGPSMLRECAPVLESTHSTSRSNPVVPLPRVPRPKIPIRTLDDSQSIRDPGDYRGTYLSTGRAEHGISARPRSPSPVVAVRGCTRIDAVAAADGDTHGGGELPRWHRGIRTARRAAGHDAEGAPACLWTRRINTGLQTTPRAHVAGHRANTRPRLQLRRCASDERTSAIHRLSRTAPAR